MINLINYPSKFLRTHLALTIFGVGMVLIGTAIPNHWGINLPASVSASTPIPSTNAGLELSISPPVRYLQLKPGDTSLHTITVENTSAHSITITPSLVDFVPDGESNRPILQNGTQFRFATLTKPASGFGQPVELSSHQKQDFVLSIAIPADATEGEFPLSFLATTNTNLSTTELSQTAVNGTIGSNLIVLITRSHTDKGDLKLSSIDHPVFVDSFSPIWFKVLAKNNGTNATTASGSARLINWRRHPVAEYKFYPDVILAGSSRYLRTINPLLSQEETKQTSDAIDPNTITHNFSHKGPFLFGLYSIEAALLMKPSSPDMQTQMVTTVVAFPFSIFGIIILVIALYLAYKYFVMEKST